jgi:hypothetical protein
MVSLTACKVARRLRLTSGSRKIFPRFPPCVPHHIAKVRQAGPETNRYALFNVGRIVGRTDRRGRPLKAFLQAEIVGTDVTVEEMRTACGLTRASYYGEPSGSGRGFADTFPNSEELRQLADYYQLGDDGWVKLLVEFGWLQPLYGTARTPFTATNNTSHQQTPKPVGLVQLRDALSHDQDGSILVVSPDGGQVSLVPLRQALQEHPDGSVMVFDLQPPAEA